MDKYQPIRTAVQDAGFHTTDLETMGSWDRISIASKRFEGGLTGYSFWVTSIDGRWYLGTWGGLAYAAPSDEACRQFVLHVLTKGGPTPSHFDPAACAQYQITQLDDETVDRVLPDDRPGIDW